MTNAPSDSRLLLGLIKAERNYITHLRSSVQASFGASGALSSWGTSEAPDVAEASARIGNLLTACAEVQSTHVAAIEGYRAALKDVADREASIRTVVRDRDILVGRLVKANQKSASLSSKKSPEERAEKVAKAQRELAACEQVLLSEEAALVGVKRRTFKEALTMRMKTMGDAGASMVDAAKEAILLLNDFDSNAYQLPYSPNGYEEHSGAMSGYDAHDQHPYQEQYDAGGEHTGEGGHRGVQLEDNGPYPIDHLNFENQSVTPSQSASQVFQPYPNRSSAQYNAPFGSIAEQQHADQEHQQHAKQRGGDETDSDEEDWHESFGGGEQRIVAHQGGGAILPAPHQLDARAGAEADFMPQGQDVDSDPAPAPPAKDEDKRLSRGTLSLKKKSSKLDSQPPSQSQPPPPPQRQLNYVFMPPVPSAPRLDSNGVDMGSVPKAPKLYERGMQNESSSEDEAETVMHRGEGSAWQSRIDSRQNDAASSDDGTAPRTGQRENAPRKSGSFFGKVGRLFKGEERKGAEPSPSASPERRARPMSTQWDTRTDSNIRHNSVRVQNPSSIGRRQSILRGPLVPRGDDSSDDEQVDETKLVRHVNQGPPLWQKSNSDVGFGKKLTSGITKPASLKRTPSASVVAGPMSWKAHQASGSQLGLDNASTAGAEATKPSLSRSSTLASTTLSKKKKKKSKAPSIDGGSEIGTQSTRTRPGASATTTAKRNSIFVTGDASAGVRRSDSLNYGSMLGTADSLSKRSSKRLSAMSTHQVHGYGNKSGAINPADPSGKFATSNWVAKSNVPENDAAEVQHNQRVAKPAAPPKAPPLKAPTPVRASAKKDEREPPKHVPQPSRTMSPPLKPALKNAQDMTRTSSAPRLPQPISAPPAASLLLSKMDEIRAPGSVLSLRGDESIDGTGSLNFPNMQGGHQRQREISKEVSGASTPRTALPRIDMPKSEPFRVDLEDSKDKQLNTPQRERLHTGGGDTTPLLTPNEHQAYSTFFTDEGNSEDTVMKKEQSPVVEKPGTPSGVTRTTVARASVGSGVLGPKNVPPPMAAPATSLTAPKLSRSYSGDVALSSDSSDDGEVQAFSNARTVGAEGGHTPAMAAAAKKPASILSNSHLHTNAIGGDGIDKSPDGSGVGSTVSRRKSVRMAPDVKLPPETPPITQTPNKPSTQLVLPSTYKPASRPQLSDRIAPPPPAPTSRASSGHMERPIDLGAMREPSSWSTRIGMSRDDSSDEDDEADQDGGYDAARRNFGSISRTWGKTVGKKTYGGGGGESGGAGMDSKPTSTKTKKKKPTNNSGYNPAIPLPMGMQVVGRSASKRGP